MDKGQTLKASCLHIVDPSSETAEMKHKFSSYRKRLSIGSSQLVDPRTLVKTRFCGKNTLRTPTNQPCLRIHHLSHTDVDRKVADSLCDSLRKGLNWISLSKFFDSVCLTDAIVEQVLLEFKQPADSTRALKFFHWAAHCKSFQHKIKSYSIIIHITVSGRLINDARALIESALQRNACDSEFSVVDCLLDTYKVTNSCPFVFDLVVQCYSKMRMFDSAFEVCRYLDKHGFCPSLISFNTLLHVIKKSEFCENALIWWVYGFMIERRVYGNEVTVKIMVDALCKAGELKKFVDIASRIHGKKCPPMVVVNASLVLRMLGEGKVEEGILVLKRLMQKNMMLDTVCYSLIVYARIRMGDLDSAREVYEEMLKRGFSPNPFVHTAFIGAYCNKGMIEEAINSLQEMKDMGLGPYDETYSFVIAGCARKEKAADGLRVCEEMMQKGMLPNKTVFNELVRGLCEAGGVEQANKILTLLLDKGFSPDEITYSHLIEGYKDEGNVQEVLKLYYEMEFRSLSPGFPVYTSLISVLCEHGKVNHAEKYLAAMRDRDLQPTAAMYKLLIASHLEKGDKEKALYLQNEMAEKLRKD